MSLVALHFLEALAAGSQVIASDTEPNLEKKIFNFIFKKEQLF